MGALSWKVELQRLIDFVPSFYGIRGVDGLAINLGEDLVFGITIAIGVFEITDP